MIKNQITKRYASSTTLVILILIIIFGYFASYVTRFSNNIENQDKILLEIRNTQLQLQSTENEVGLLRDQVTALTDTVCILTNQIEALGAVPVQTVDGCLEKIQEQTTSSQK